MNNGILYFSENVWSKYLVSKYAMGPNEAGANKRGDGEEMSVRCEFSLVFVLRKFAIGGVGGRKTEDNRVAGDDQSYDQPTKL